MLHFHPITVREVRPDTDESVVVAFDVPPSLADTFRFRHGQYLTLRALVDGQDLRRSYSICSGVDDGELRVGIRRVPGGVFSAWASERLKPGDAIEAIPPQGHFTLPLDAQARRHVVGIAGGSGITPILSIMRTVLAREPLSRFTLIYGNRSQKSTMFKEELEDLKNRYMQRLVLHHVFSREHVDAPINAGRLDRAKVAEFLQTLVPVSSIDEVFVCGPHGVNDEAEAALREAGIAPEKIHIERFGVPGLPTGAPAPHETRPEDAELAKVTIVRDGITREIEFRKSDPSLLDAAARAGLDVPYSCKSGVCSTCRAKLIEGQVRMDRNFALEKGEVAAGFILTCQSHPLTERVVVSFDER